MSASTITAARLSFHKRSVSAKRKSSDNLARLSDENPPPCWHPSDGHDAAALPAFKDQPNLWLCMRLRSNNMILNRKKIYPMFMILQYFYAMFLFSRGPPRREGAFGMDNAFLRLFGRGSVVAAESTWAVATPITVPRGRFAYVPVSASQYPWLKRAHFYLCSSHGGKARLLPWWRYPKARWGTVSPDLRAWARSHGDYREDRHLLSNASCLFYSRPLRPKRRLVAEMELHISAGADLPWPEIHSLVSQVIRLVPFIPPLEAEDRQLVRLLLLGRRGAELATELGWSATKIRSRMARLCRLFDAQSYAQLMECLWLAHQRKSFNEEWSKA